MSTTAAPAASLAQIALGDLAHEIANTRRVLERVPDDQFAWKPHAKSMSLGELAQHTANIPGWGTYTLSSNELDFAAPMPPQESPGSSAALVAALDAGKAQLLDMLAAASDETLLETWTARKGEHVVFALPRVQVLRSMILNHLIHHRAQLGVYLRLLDVPVPGVYGPTADES